MSRSHLSRAPPPWLTRLVRRRGQSRRKISYSGVNMQLRFRRLCNYYLSNVALTCFFISSFAFSAWAMPPEKVASSAVATTSS